MRASLNGRIAAALLGALTLLGAVGVAGANGASASPLSLFVNGATGRDTNTCTTVAVPCATIGHAVSLAAPGETIHVAAGTYAEQLVISKAVTIVGASNTLTVIEPSVPTTTQTLVADTDPDRALPDYAIVDVTAGTTDVNLRRLAVDGANAQTPFDSCSAGSFIGVYYHDATGTMTGVRVVGLQFPLADFGCQSSVGLGVYAASDGANPTDVTMHGVKVSSFGKNGITCHDPDTTCSISNSSAVGIGPTSLTAQNGIEIFGASATLTADHVSNESYTGGGAGNSASGILLLNAGSLSVTNSSAKFCDVDIYLGEIPAFGLVPPGGFGTWTITGNTAAHATDNVAGGTPGPANDGGAGNGYGDGIQIDSVTNTHSVTVSNNFASHDFEYGIALLGSTGVTLHGNQARGDHDGLYVGGPGSAVDVSTSNSVSNNIFNGNHADGILADGIFSPPVGSPYPTESANTFTANNLEMNTTWQAQDLSTGGGTAGTANTWTSNTCIPRRAPSTPNGLC